MAGKDFSVAEIQAILKTCKDSGVGQLQIGTFKVSFLPAEPKTPEAATPTPEQIRAAKEYEAQVFEEHEKRIREEQLSNLRLSDPEAYEDLVNRGELTDAGKESDGIDA
jgi:restriction endonuclease Mrr